MLKFKHEPRLLYFSRALIPRTLVLIIAAVALMVVDQHYDALSRVRGALMTAVYPTQWLVSAPTAAWRELMDDLASRSALLAQNDRLQRDYMLAQIHLQRLEALRRENERLRTLLNAAGTMRGRVMAVSVLSMNTNPFANRIVINAGRNIGIHEGQPLLDANGIVGQTLHVGAITTQVMLITDPASAVPVEIARTGLATVAVGTGNLNLLSLPYVPNSADVRPGDRLLTSGLGGLYPRGYPVGVVTTVEPRPGRRFAEIRARPLAHLGRERQVLVYFAGRSDTP